jgi:hypothetical protein
VTSRQAGSARAKRRRDREVPKKFSKIFIHAGCGKLNQIPAEMSLDGPCFDTLLPNQAGAKTGTGTQLNLNDS